MNSSPLVTVIIPAYNSQKTISETIESVLSQSYKNLEVIIIDDGSTDNTKRQVKRYIDKNVHYYWQENKGACTARNKGFSLCSGEYIQYLDADDLISQTKIEEQLKIFKLYGNEIVVSAQWDRFQQTINEAQFPDRCLDKDWDKPIDWLINSWEGKGMIAQHAWLTPRSLVEKAGPWNEDLMVNQDGEFFARVLLNSKAIKFCFNAKAYYRSDNSNTVSKVLKKDKAASLLLSYQLYQQSVLPFQNSVRVRHAVMMNYLRFIYRFYGKYPDLCMHAKNYIRQLGFRKLPPHGGQNFKILAKVIGFENTLKLRSIFNR